MDSNSVIWIVVAVVAAAKLLGYEIEELPGLDYRVLINTQSEDDNRTDPVRRVRYTTDTRASGSGTYDIATGRVEGKVSVAGTSVSVRWTPGMDQAIAKIRGAVLGVPSPL